MRVEPSQQRSSGRAKRGWWAAVAGFAAFTLVMSVIPLQDAPSVRDLDKVWHLCQYLLFAWLLVQAIRTHFASQNLLQDRDPLIASYASHSLLWAWIYASSYGLLIEVIQAMLPWRSADLLDAAANAAGAALGVWVGQRIPRRRA